MADELETVAPVPEVATPPIAAEEEPTKIEDDLSGAEETAEGEGEESEETESEPVLTDEEVEEFDWNGKKITAPKGLKDGVMMHADYTKKTQEVAQTRKELEAYERRVQEQAKAGEEDLTLRAQYVSKAERLEQYRKVDWAAWVNQDPVAAQAANIEHQQLEREVMAIGQTIQQRTQQRSYEAQQDIAKRINETREFAQKEIKGWTPELDVKIGDFARAQGIDDQALQAAMNPTIYKVLHLAFLGSQVLNKPAVPKPVLKPPVPLQIVGAKANPPAQKSLQDMSMDEYVAFRKKQGALG